MLSWQSESERGPAGGLYNNFAALRACLLCLLYPTPKPQPIFQTCHYKSFRLYRPCPAISLILWTARRHFSQGQGGEVIRQGVGGRFWRAPPANLKVPSSFLPPTQPPTRGVADFPLTRYLQVSFSDSTRGKYELTSKRRAVRSQTCSGSRRHAVAPQPNKVEDQHPPRDSRRLLSLYSGISQREDAELPRHVG